MRKYIILIISLILDIILLNILPFTYNDINYLFPMFFIISLFLIYPLFNTDKNYFLTIFISSIIYGGLFYNNILLGISSIMLLGLFTKLYNKYLNLNNISMLIGIILVIILNNTYIYLVLSFSLISVFSFNILFYKIKRSILLNLIYSLIIYNLLITSSSKNIF